MLKQKGLLALVLTTCMMLVSDFHLYGQSTHRTDGTPSYQKIGSDPADVPCAGSVVYEEDFEAGFPAGWTVVDGDGLTPRTETGLMPGWQLGQDYKDTTNHLMLSPSWYDNGGGVSNDWVISPQISLGSNSCLSWTAYSQDDGFLEAYEVYISTTGNDTSDFLAQTMVDTVFTERNDYTIRALSLVDYAGQDIYVAFRQVSDDKFVLTLDNFKVSNITPLDIGAASLAYGSPSPGDTVAFSIEVVNYGSDTVTAFDLCYSVNGGAVACMAIDSVLLPPNQSFNIIHETEYLSDTLDGFEDFCAWTDSPNNGADNDVANDTLCQTIAIGSPVGLSDPGVLQLAWDLYPNPSEGQASIRITDLKGQFELQVMDVNGKVQWIQTGLRAGSATTFDWSELPAGLYLVRLQAQDGREGTKRFLKY